MTIIEALRAVEGAEKGIRRKVWPAWIRKSPDNPDKWQWSGLDCDWIVGFEFVPSDILADDWEVQG